jgi:hypothetical protein
MKWTPWVLGSFAAFAISACGGERRDTGAAGNETETGTMQGGVSTDSAMPAPGAAGTTSDTAHGGLHSDTTAAGATGTADSARGNQTKSGVTDTRTGKSTLGPGVTQTRPDQGAPVTSKGDTVRSGGDTTGAGQ